MINLYQILKISPYSTDTQIYVALQQYQKQNNVNPKVIQATTQWLLVPHVRQRYDERLQNEQPAFFQAAQTQQNHIIIEDNIQDDDEYTYEGHVPYLWNPKAAAIWAFFLPPAMGAWLHAQNWRELGETKLAQQNMNAMWGLIGAAFVLALLHILTGTDLGVLGNIVIWAIWFFTLGKKQIDVVRDELNNNYERKPWGKVIGVVILALLGFLIAVTILVFMAMIAGIAHPSLFK